MGFIMSRLKDVGREFGGVGVMYAVVRVSSTVVGT